MDTSGRMWESDSFQLAAKEVGLTLIVWTHEPGLERQGERSQSRLGLSSFFGQCVGRKSNFQRLDLVRLGMHADGMIVYSKVGNRSLPEIGFGC